MTMLPMRSSSSHFQTARGLSHKQGRGNQRRAEGGGGVALLRRISQWLHSLGRPVVDLVRLNKLVQLTTSGSAKRLLAKLPQAAGNWHKE